jgi:hypothetical protein
MTEELPKGYKCLCKEFNSFSSWVYAHWDERITHACDCGRQNVIRRGRVLLFGAKKDLRHVDD